MSAEDTPDPPEEVWPLLVDAHCHPTDDPRPWEDIEALTRKLAGVQVGRVCAMSTSIRDQALVSQLASRLPHKVVPAFGYHPWFSHLIACEPFNDPKDHYRALFHEEKAQDELADLLPGLPDPIPLSHILTCLRSDLEAHPDALLGEVGIDRAFRLPNDPKGWTREPDSEGSHTLALRDRPLTNLNTPMEHQLRIIKEQISIAVELGRSVSLHSVRAGGATVSLLEDLSRTFPSKGQGLNKRERRRLQREEARCVDEEEKGGEAKQKSFQSINVDLHSCTLSPTIISQLQNKYANVFVSFSIAINARQKDLHAQLLACDPKRLLIESDYHSAEDLGSRCWQMIRLAVDVLGDKLIPSSGSEEDRYVEAAKMFERNWNQFIHP